MPNWVVNKIVFNGEGAEKALSSHIVNGEFDFNTIIPMPKELEGTDAVFGDDKPNWYNWRIKNWGCKWNARLTRCEGNTIKFDTPWGPCVYIYDALVKMYPDIEFEFLWADEDIGCNCGMGKKEGDELMLTVYDDCSKQAYETYFELWGTLDCFVYDEEQGTYVYRDVIEEQVNE